MHAPSNWYNPPLGHLPGVISLAMLTSFLHCLPRPRPGASRALGRQMIQDALAALDAWSPRDRFEALLVLQIPTLLLAAQEVEAEARAAPDFDQRMRLYRRVAVFQRRVEGLGAEVRRHRRELAVGQDLQHAPPPQQGYDLDALEAVWREPARELPETALEALPLAVVAARYGIAMDPPGVETPAGPVAAAVDAGPDGKLEDRDEFEVEPPPRFQGVPLWKQRGRKYLDELPDEELAELVAAQKRGEVIEEPPQRPLEWSEP